VAFGIPAGALNEGQQPSLLPLLNYNQVRVGDTQRPPILGELYFHHILLLDKTGNLPRNLKMLSFVNLAAPKPELDP
jgi:hypothetical protein